MNIQAFEEMSERTAEASDTVEQIEHCTCRAPRGYVSIVRHRRLLHSS